MRRLWLCFGLIMLAALLAPGLQARWGMDPAPEGALAAAAGRCAPLRAVGCARRTR